MKTPLELLVSGLTLLALATLNSQLSTAFAQGSLTPPGAPVPTMKTLDQIEPRTPISSAPFTISAPGSYYLTTNLTAAGGNAITIATNGVTLDLNGFTIASTAASATGTGILLNSGLSDLTIFNGHIRGGVTNNGSGVYSGSGFGSGISYSSSQAANERVTGVSVNGCLTNGIYLGANNPTVVESCTVMTVGSLGIVASTIKSSVAVDCGSDAIYGFQVSDSRGQSTGSGRGLYAITALNCYGYSVAGTGLYANRTAQNCYGYSISANGLNAGDIAIGCSGYNAFGGTGLSAYIANSCRGTTDSGTAQNTTYKYNMP